MLKIPTDMQARVDSLTREFEEHFCFIVGQPVRIVTQLYPAIITESLIRQVLCDGFEVTWEQLLEQNRKQPIAAIRQCYCFLCHCYLDVHPGTIGNSIQRDRSTVLQGIDAVRDYIDTDDPMVCEKLIPIMDLLNKIRDGQL